MLPDYGASTGTKKIVPYLSFKVTQNAFVGNNENNERINFKLEQGDNVLFDMNNIVSGFQWFAGGGKLPDKVWDQWNTSGDKPSVVPAQQPSGTENADGKYTTYKRFAEIPVYSSKLGARIFSFDGASTYKTAQSLVVQWLDNLANQNGIVYLYQFTGVRAEQNPRDATRQNLIPEFSFKSVISRPSEFDHITPMNGNKASSQSLNDDKMPF